MNGRGNRGEKPTPYRALRADRQPMAMAGVWQNYEVNGSVITTCAIVTTEANKTMSEIHHRLPVIIDPEDWPLWLGEDGKGAAKLMRANCGACFGFAKGKLCCEFETVRQGQNFGIKFEIIVFWILSF